MVSCRKLTFGSSLTIYGLGWLLGHQHVSALRRAAFVVRDSLANHRRCP